MAASARATTRTDLARPALAWAAFGVLGAGVVHLGLAGAHVTSPAWALALAAVGLAETGWSLLALRAGRPVSARPAAAALLAVAGTWPVLVAQDVAPRDGGLTAADVAAVLLGVVGAAGIALASRPGATPRRRRPRPGLRLAGWAAAAVVAAAITTPGLAATPAGAAAVPHGTHGEAPAPAPAAPPASPADGTTAHGGH